MIGQAFLNLRSAYMREMVFQIVAGGELNGSQKIDRWISQSPSDLVHPNNMQTVP